MSHEVQLKVIVTLKKQREELWIFCLRHISYTPDLIFMQLGSNVHLIKQMCRTNVLAMSAISQSHTWWSNVWALNYVSAPYLLYP